MIRKNSTSFFNLRGYLLSFFMLAWSLGLNAQSRQIEKINTGTKSIEGSEITVLTTNYAAGSTVDLSFKYNFVSADMEWGKTASIDFPAGVTVNSASAVGALTYGGETGDGALVTWGGAGHQEGNVEFTVNVTIDAGFTGDVSMDWTMAGDNYGSAPHSTSGTISIAPFSSEDAGISALVNPESLFVAETKDVIVELTNFGTNNLTAVSISWSVNGTPQSDYSWTGDLVQGATENVTLGSFDFSAGGAFTIIAETSSPNGLSDGNTGNDQLNIEVTAIAPLSLPYTQNFDGVTAPAIPSDWSIIDTDGSTYSFIKTQNYGSSYSSPNELVLYNSFFTSVDLLLVSPMLEDISKVIVKLYASGTPFSIGTMSDPTDAATYSEFTTVTTTDTYAEYKIDFTTYVGTDVYIAIKHPTTETSKYIYVDDITIYEPVGNDALVSGFVSPNAKIAAATTDIIVTIKNNGTNNLTSVDINWDIDGGAVTTYSWTGDLATDATEDVTIGSYNFDAEGTFTVNAATLLPNGVADEGASNDENSQSVKVYPAGTVIEAEPNNTWDAAGVKDLSGTGIGTLETYGTDFWHVDALSGQILTATITSDGNNMLQLYKEVVDPTTSEVSSVLESTLVSGEGYSISEDATYHLKVSSTSGSDFDYTLVITLTADSESPKITSITPAHGATDIDNRTDIQIAFNELIYYNDGSDLNETNLLNCFAIKEGSASGTDVTFTASYNETTKKVTLTPAADLTYEAKYYTLLNADMIQDGTANLAADSSFYFTVEVAPVVVTMPLEEGFESETFPPVNWELTGDESGWSRETNGSVTFPEGSYGARFSTYSLSTLRTPIIDMSSATAPRLQFKWADGMGSYTCKVNISTDGGATFNEIYNVTAADANWIEAKIDLNDFSAETIIEFDLEGSWSGGTYLDEIKIAEKPTTPIYSISSASHDFGSIDLLDDNTTYAFEVSNIGGGTMNLTNAVLSGADASEFSVVNANIPAAITTDAFELVVKFNPSSEGAKVAVLTLTVDGEDHTINLQGEGNDSEIKSLPYECDFETGTTLPDNWVALNDLTVSPEYTRVEMRSDGADNKSLNLYNWTNTAGNLMAVMPPSQINESNALITFNANNNAAVNPINFELGYLTDKTDPTTYVKLKDFSVVNEKCELDMSTVSITGVYYLVFKHGLSDSYQSLYIDNIRWAIPTTDATLSDLTSNYATIDGFSADVLSYTIKLDAGVTSAPVVGATANSSYASLDITQAAAVPGSATVLVTAEDGSTKTYTVNYVNESDDATLSDLTVDGTTVAAFDAATLSYYVELAYGTTDVPEVIGTATDSNADVAVNATTSLPGATTVVVTAEDGTTQKTYSVNFTIAANNDATLSNLKVNGGTVDSFDAATLIYNIELPYGTTDIPEVIGTATDSNAGVVVNDATVLPGTTTVVVTAEDGTTKETYTVNFTIADANTDASLSDLKTDGTTIDGFASTTLVYNIELPYGTTDIPEVTAITSSSSSNAVVTDANTLPGKATVVVTAQDGTTTKTYEVNFTVAKNNVATLSDLTVDGTTVTAFDAATMSYSVELAYGTTVVPTVEGVATDSNADVKVTKATSLPGTTTVVVTAEDGTTTETYSVNFTIEANNDATLSDLTVDGTTVAAFDAATISYNVELAYGTTVIPTVEGVATDANAGVNVTKATALPGTTTVVVTAEDGITEKTYTVNFTIAANNDASLSNLTVDGTTVAAFDAATLSYDVELAYGTTVVPTVDGIATDSNADIKITKATSLPGTTTVVVTAEDGTTKVTYSVNFIIAANNDATLSDLTIDGTTVTGFEVGRLNYTVQLAYGTTEVPEVVGVPVDANAEVVVNDATELPGATTVIVTAEDKTTIKTFTVNFTIAAPSTDASLSDLQVDGETIDGFDPATLTYDVELPFGSKALPVITAVTADPNADYSITPVVSLPGAAGVLVTAEDGTTTKVYEINFTVAANNDASLSDLTVDGVTVTGFDAATLTYDVELAEGTTSAPVVVATATDSNADVVVTDATEIPGTTTIKVVAEDGITTETYSVNFTVTTGLEITIEKNLKVFPIPCEGEFTVDLGYNIQNNGTWTICNLNGQVVTHGVINQSRFDVSYYSRGVYILTINVDQQKVAKRIVIE